MTDNKKFKNVSFGALILSERIRQKVSREKLCVGLMSEANLCYIENDERETDASTMARLADRLGIVYEDEGTYLFSDDFEEWCIRWDIINAVENNNFSFAEELIDKYTALYKENNIRKQFCDVMEVQCILKKKIISQAKDYNLIREIAEKYNNALRLTQPDIDNNGIKNSLMSLDELNILLEYRFSEYIGNRNRYKNLDDFNGMFEDIFNYLDMSSFSISAKAKLYPKIVVYMWRIMEDYGKVENLLADGSPLFCSRLCLYCENALEFLRAATIKYYLVEILEIRLKLIENGLYGLQTELLQKQTKEWLLTVRNLCRENGISEYTMDCCYFYKENTVYNIGNVIHTRRKMLGITMEQLYDGICSEKTLRRLEHGKAKTHRKIADELLGKLGLPAGYQRIGVITDDRDAIELYNMFKKLCREFKYEDCKNVLENIEVLLQDNLVNKQFIEWARLTIEYELGEIDYTKFIMDICDIIPVKTWIKKILKKNDIFLSNNEEIILYSISAKYKYNGYDKKAFEYIESICSKMQNYDIIQIQKNIRNYELFMTYFASVLGSIENYEESNKVSKNVIKGQLAYGRIGMISNNLSSMAWNEYKKFGDKKAYIERLNQCMLWSSLCKNSYFEKRYKDRIKTLENYVSD